MPTETIPRTILNYNPVGRKSIRGREKDDEGETGKLPNPGIME